MRIEVTEKIQTTQKEFDSVNQNNRPSISDEIHRDVKRRKRGRYNPGDGTFEEFVEDHFID